MDNNSNSYVVKEEKKIEEKITENDLKTQIRYLNQSVIGSNVINDNLFKII